MKGVQKLHKYIFFFLDKCVLKFLNKLVLALKVLKITGCSKYVIYSFCLLFYLYKQYNFRQRYLIGHLDKSVVPSLVTRELSDSYFLSTNYYGVSFAPIFKIRRWLTKFIRKLNEFMRI